jgi:hypothetical protein
MPEFIFDESRSPADRFGVPRGEYDVTFQGTEEHEPFAGPSRFGNKASPEPRLAWLLRVTRPARFAGKVIKQFSGNRPAGPKSNFNKMLRFLVGRTPEQGERINTDDYIGRSYRIEVDVNPQSQDGNLHVAYMKPLDVKAGKRQQVEDDEDDVVEGAEE